MLRSAVSAFPRVFDAPLSRLRASSARYGAVRRSRGRMSSDGPSARPSRGRLRQDSFLTFRTWRPLYMPVFKSR
jgi:hypothetical protein